MAGAAAADRIAGFGTSIFTEITRLSSEHGAVNLGQGFPDFPAPDFVKAAAARAIAADHNQYAAASGLPRLRAAVATHFEDRHGLRPDSDSEITIGGGATECLFDAVMALVNPGDEVIVFEPFYDAYVPAIRMAGGVPRVVTLRPPDWRWDGAQLRAAFSPRTRLCIINTPHNPTGKVFSADELDELGELVIAHDALVLSDEVYSEILFDGARHVPIATRPGMWDRTVTVDSLGKTFSVTGWKIGWAIAPPRLTAAIRAVHQFVTFCNATPLQEAAADALTQARSNGYFEQLKAVYGGRRDLMAGLLRAAGLPLLPVQGAYFLLADASGLGFPDDIAFCMHLIKDIGVAAIPPSAFYADPKRAPLLARFCFAKRDETMRAAGPRLLRLAGRPARPG